MKNGAIRFLVSIIFFAGNWGFADDFSSFTVGSGGGIGSITLTLPSIFSVSGSPLTADGTLSATFASQSANLALMSPNGSTGAPTMRRIVAADVSSGTASARMPMVADGSGNSTFGSQYIAAGVYTGAANPRTYLYDDGTFGQLSLYAPAYGQWTFDTQSSGNPLTLRYGGTYLMSWDPSQTVKTINLSGWKINEDFWAHFPSQRTLLSAGSTATKIFQAYTGDIWSFIIILDCSVRLFDTDKLNWASYYRRFVSYGNGTNNTASFPVPGGVAITPDLFYNGATASGSTFTAGNTNLTGYMCTNNGQVWDWCLKIDNPSANSVMATVDCQYQSAHYN